MVGLTENKATKPSLAGAWAELCNTKIEIKELLKMKGNRQRKNGKWLGKGRKFGLSQFWNKIYLLKKFAVIC